MDIDEKKLWRLLAAVGTVFTLCCCSVSVLQFVLERQYEISFARKYVSLAINIVAFAGFTFLVFKPLYFICYAMIFYVYGLGNIFDFGNILGALCILASFTFLYFAGFFKKHFALKMVIFSLPPIAMLWTQFFVSGTLPFLLSVMHILGATYIFSLVFNLLYPRIKESESIKKTKKLDPEMFSKQDVEFLTRVLAGEKYSKIAAVNNISESKVKARMLELYHFLEVKDRVEFIAIYKNAKFTTE